MAFMKYQSAFVFSLSAFFHACTTDASLGVRPDAGNRDAVVATDSSDAAPSDPSAWLQTLRGTGSVTVDRLLLDGRGNVVIAGRASGQVDFGGGN